jgi:hypothetical protein
VIYICSSLLQLIVESRSNLPQAETYLFHYMNEKICFKLITCNEKDIIFFNQVHPEAKLACEMKKNNNDVRDYYHMRVSRKNRYSTFQVGPKLVCRVLFKRPKPTVDDNFFMRPL